MRANTSLLLLFLLTLLLNSSNYVFAAPPTLHSSASQTLRGVIFKAKGAGNFHPFLDHVHWPETFKRLNSTLRMALHVNSPEQFRIVSSQLLKSPSDTLSQALGARVGTLSNGGGIFLAGLGKVAFQKLDTELDDANSRLRSSEFGVLQETKITPNHVLIDVAEKGRGIDERHTVSMKSFGGRWFLDPDLLNDTLQRKLPAASL